MFKCTDIVPVVHEKGSTGHTLDDATVYDPNVAVAYRVLIKVKSDWIGPDPSWYHVILSQGPPITCDILDEVALESHPRYLSTFNILHVVSSKDDMVVAVAEESLKDFLARGTESRLRTHESP